LTADSCKTSVDLLLATGICIDGECPFIVELSRVSRDYCLDNILMFDVLKTGTEYVGILILRISRSVSDGVIIAIS